MGSYETIFAKNICKNTVPPGLIKAAIDIESKESSSLP
jgi:hypothetical protein